jgi:hypothetical protein
VIFSHHGDCLNYGKQQQGVLALWTMEHCAATKELHSDGGKQQGL